MGNVANPLGFTPHQYCSWQGRFDDPERVFRTLYAAEDPLTCLREALRNLKPSMKVLEKLDPTGAGSGLPLPAAWRALHSLAPAHVSLTSGDLIDLVSSDVRSRLELELRSLLVERGYEHLNIPEIQSSDRDLTQAIAKALQRAGAAGILYPSKFDIGRCLALFEGRAELLPAGEPRSLTDSLPELEEVCREFRLRLDTGSRT